MRRLGQKGIEKKASTEGRRERKMNLQFWKFKSHKVNRSMNSKAFVNTVCFGR